MEEAEGEGETVETRRATLTPEGMPASSATEALGRALLRICQYALSNPAETQGRLPSRGRASKREWSSRPRTQSYTRRAYPWEVGNEMAEDPEGEHPHG